jgi:hypothetical protein
VHADKELQNRLRAVARIGVLVNPDDPTDAQTIPRLAAAARALGVTLELFDHGGLSLDMAERIELPVEKPTLPQRRP